MIVRRIVRRALAAWIGGWILCASAYAAEARCTRVVVSADPQFPPFAWYDGNRLQGASVDIVLTALERIGLPYELRYAGPFLRLLRAAELGEVDIITELKNTPDRRAYLSFVPTPIFSNPSSVFVRSGADFKYTGWADLKGKRGGVTHGTRFGGGFDEYLEAHLRIEQAPGIRENFQKLAAGRVDYFVTPYFPALSHLIAERKENHFIALKPDVVEVENFVGWSRRSPCLTRLPEFDAELARLVRSGAVRRSVEAATQAWRKAPVMAR